MITFDEVTKAFPGGTVAVDNLSMQLPTGKITVFVGPSGCGKTTSLRMINRTIDLMEKEKAEMPPLRAWTEAIVAGVEAK